MNIIVETNQQKLFLYNNQQLICSYDISTAKNGLGEQEGSYKTPRGLHKICQKIGENAPENTVFIGRKANGKIYSETLAKANPERRWILTRILRLDGLEEGKNRGGNVDTLKRYIYIHGVPDSIPMGTPSSIGCIQMHNNDIIELFDRVEVGVEVLIQPEL